ncbi:MAG: hypothetical protein GY926_03085 [bacterium]|nr:hypothetical protein [bacterium]
MSEAPSNGSFDALGLHLTDSEFLEMERRAAIESELEPIAAAVQDTGLTEEDAYEEGLSNEDWMGIDFGGSWIDQMDGGKLRVAIRTGPGFAAAQTRATSVVDDLIGAGRIAASDVELVPVVYSLAELTDVADAFFDGPHAKYVEGFAYTPSVMDNALVIDAEPDVQKAAEEFAKGYPTGMVVVRPVPKGGTTFYEIGNPASPHDDPHAGVAIDLVEYGGGESHACTWGFTARQNDVLNAIVASHCLPGHDGQSGAYYGLLLASDVRATGQILSGYSTTYGYYGERGDIGKAAITRPYNMDDPNCYHADLDCNSRILRRMYTSETSVGTTMCASMRTANDWHCGVIITNNWSGTVNGVHRKWMRQINYAGADGDSGSGWRPFQRTSADKAMGIASFSNYANSILVTHMYYGETKLNVITCGTSGVC